MFLFLVPSVLGIVLIHANYRLAHIYMATRHIYYVNYVFDTMTCRGPVTLCTLTRHTQILGEGRKSVVL